MVGFEERKADLEALDVAVFAASVDTDENAQIVQDDVSFNIGQGIGKDVADALGAWWQPKRNFIQPSEFIVGPENKILHASYSSGPIARTLVDDVIELLGYISNRSK